MNSLDEAKSRELEAAHVLLLSTSRKLSSLEYIDLFCVFGMHFSESFFESKLRAHVFTTLFRFFFSQPAFDVYFQLSSENMS